MFSARTNWSLETNRFTQGVERLRLAGRELIDLTASNPTTVGLSYESDAIPCALSNAQVMEYHPEPRGMLSARETVSEYYRARNAAISDLSPEQILLTASTSEGYSFLFRLLCEAGDEVLAPAPSYPLFEYLAGLNDVHVRQYPLFYDHGWHIDLHALEQGIGPRTRAILVVHPNNPTGSYVSREEMAALDRLCAERGLALIADEVFFDFNHGKEQERSFTENAKALTFTLSGLSKICGLPQMKLAWMVVSGPKHLLAEAMERLEVIADTYLSVNTPVQVAAPELFALAPRFQEQLMARIRSNLAELDGRLKRQKECRRLEVEGGWYAVLRVPATGTDEDLAISLLERHGVLVHPGHFYDFPSDGFLVISLIAAPEDFAPGIEKLLVHAA